MLRQPQKEPFFKKGDGWSLIGVVILIALFFWGPHPQPVDTSAGWQLRHN